MKLKNISKGASQVAWLAAAFALTIMIVYVLSQGLVQVQGLTDWIISVFGGGGGGARAGVSELGDALLCAHWRCKRGCDYVIDMNMKIGTGEDAIPCPCEESWDLDGDGKICGATESKTHPIKSESTEDTIVSENWWKEEACITTCSDADFYKNENCKHEWTPYSNAILFDEDTMECTSNNAKCTVPRGTWYIWAYDSGGQTTTAIICDDKPAGAATCASQCGGVCGSAPPSDPTCSGSTCTYHNDIGRNYCDSGNCYCPTFETNCDCGVNGAQECTASGCRVIESKSFFCCQSQTPPPEPEAIYGWSVQGWLCDRRVEASECGDTCEEKCTAEGFDSVYYNPSGEGDDAYICICSDPTHCSVYTDESECPTDKCKWCDKCDGIKALYDEKKWDKCIGSSEYCGGYICTFNECNNNGCGGFDTECTTNQQFCNDDCQCENYYCCYDEYGGPVNINLMNICMTASSCYAWGGIPTDPDDLGQGCDIRYAASCPW
jgi:hypothetical protein